MFCHEPTQHLGFGLICGLRGRTSSMYGKSSLWLAWCLASVPVSSSDHNIQLVRVPFLQAICADLSTHFLGRDQWLMREVERILSASPSGSQWHHVHHWQCRWKTWVTGWGDVAVVYGTFGEREDWSWTSQVLHLLLDDFMLHAALLHFYLCLMVLQKIVYNCNANYMYLQHRCIDSDVHSFVCGNFSIHPI